MIPIIKEMYIDETNDGVMDIGWVPNPAIKREFMEFADSNTYYYTLKPEYTGDDMTLDTSHDLCLIYAKGESVSYTEKEIKSWSRYTNNKWGFTDDAKTFFNNFPREGASLPLFGCRHMLKKTTNFSNYMFFEFSDVSNETKPKRVKGPVLIAGVPIPRPPEDIKEIEPGYVFFSNDTVEKLQQKFGINSKSKIYHLDYITDNVIMTKSWVDKSDEKHWVWMAEYYVLNDELWNKIQKKEITGFSININAKLK